MGQLLSESQILQLRKDFPLLSRPGRGGREIAYLDWAATSQKPDSVIEAESEFYRLHNGAVNRGTHLLADEASQMFEDARWTIADFIGAEPEEIIWTKNSTEALNLLAYSLGNPGKNGQAPLIGRGDRIICTPAEHHANLVPWQELSARTGCELVFLDLHQDGSLDYQSLDKITTNTRLVAVTHASNVTGAITDLSQVVAAAKAVDAWVVADTCQSSAHLPLNVAQMGIDFCCFSAHKMLGPTGIGALWGRRELLELLPAFLTGGSMIMDVTLEGPTYQPVPAIFEAGTQPVAQIVSWAKAVEYIGEVGMENMLPTEEKLLAQLLPQLAEISGVRILGPQDLNNRLGTVSFLVEGVHPHDVGQVMDSVDIAIRVGHHCALPLHQHFGTRASCRASLSAFNTGEEIDRFLEGIEKVKHFFKVK